MWPTLLLLIYCGLLALASLLGGWIPSWMRMTHTRMQLMMSLVGGFMMAVAVLHLFPHAVLETESLDAAAISCLLGLLMTFLIIRVFPLHQHCPGHADVRDAHQAAHGGQTACAHEREPEHAVHQNPAAIATGHGPHRYSWLGLLLGLGLHTAIDGLAVAASVAAAAQHAGVTWLLGFGTFAAVLLHKPLDSLSLMSVMVAGQWGRTGRNLINVGFALICPLVALGFYFGAQEMRAQSHLAIGYALGFSAGVFLGISLADILPEIQFHRHDRAMLTAALLVGVVLAYGIGVFEPRHEHRAWHGESDHGAEPASTTPADHDQPDHDQPDHDQPDHDQPDHDHDPKPD